MSSGGTRVTVSTPLGPDALKLAGFSGEESISKLFRFDLDLVAGKGKTVAFENLLGRPILMTLTASGMRERYFSGICSGLAERRTASFTAYRMEVVPSFSLLTKKVRSRVFHDKSVPDILSSVLQGSDVGFELQGEFHPRPLCVQYRESDWDFVSRLMEEEGIYYFFKHTADGTKMVVANTPESHPDMPDKSGLTFSMPGTQRADQTVHDWEKSQELRSGIYTLWDHSFELPHNHLEADVTIQESVPVGRVTHSLQVGGNENLQIYDYPGGYAQRFDGVDPQGGDQSERLEERILEDARRTADIRMQEEAVKGLLTTGASSCTNLVPGHRFTLGQHPDANGAYVLTTVRHAAKSLDEGRFSYSNRYTCIPLGLPFRPARVTPRPTVAGTQTAFVVGPRAGETFTDKYGRVKVQFNWDREGTNTVDTSAWVRVGAVYASEDFGRTSPPQIGHEVIVDFLEGDPDQPIIVGSVYNAERMPPYTLPPPNTTPNPSPSPR